MKILFVSDFTLDQHSGGAQVSNDLIIKKGREMGHSITEHHYKSSFINFIHRWDLIISSNLDAISKSYPETLNFISNHKNHVRLEHDSCKYLTQDLRRKLFESSKINFFLSQFHLDFFRSFYGDIFPNPQIVYDPLDCGIFYPNKQSPKSYDIVYCGHLHELKGFKNLIQFAKDNPERKIDVFGWGNLNFKEIFKDYNNITFHGKVPHFKTAEIFRSATGVFHQPIENEPFCRMAAEALLCGVKEFHANENKIGSLQEYQRLGIEKFTYNCMHAPQFFWDQINQLQ